MKIEREEKKERKRKVWRGVQALKEIQKYQKGPNILIRRLLFQWLVREIAQRRREGLRFQCVSSLGAAGGGRSFSGGVPGASKPMCDSCKESHDHAEGHSVGSKDKRRLLDEVVKIIERSVESFTFF